MMKRNFSASFLSPLVHSTENFVVILLWNKHITNLTCNICHFFQDIFLSKNSKNLLRKVRLQYTLHIYGLPMKGVATDHWLSKILRSISCSSRHPGSGWLPVLYTVIKFNKSMFYYSLRYSRIVTTCSGLLKKAPSNPLYLLWAT